MEIIKLNNIKYRSFVIEFTIFNIPSLNYLFLALVIVVVIKLALLHYFFPFRQVFLAICYPFFDQFAFINVV